MSSKLYLRATTANAGTHGASELSSILSPVSGTQPTAAVRDLATTPGSSQGTLVGTMSSSTITNQKIYYGKWLSAPLQTDITAQTWTFALSGLESSANANQLFTVSVYVLKSDDTVRGYIFDAASSITTELATAQQGRVGTKSGSAVSGVAAGSDVLAVEVWTTGTESGTAGAYTITFGFDGATDPVDTTASTDAACYVSTPQDIFTALTFEYYATTPLAFRAQPATIPGSRAILIPQPVSGNAPATIFPPEGDVTASGPVPALLGTYTPAQGAVTGSGLLPSLLDTRAPSAGAVTASGPTPVLLDTRLPAEGDVTVAGQVPALLVTYDAIPVAVATAAAGVPLMEITADAAVFPLPLGLAGGILRIPGSQAILRPQEVGADPAPATIYAIPVATASSSGLVPLVLSTHMPVEGDATASGPVPALGDTWAPAQGAVTAAGQTPTLLVTYDAIPVAVATATAAVPLMEITADPAAYPFPVGLGAGIRRIPGSQAILRPQEVGADPAPATIFAVPVASATSAGLVPLLLSTHTPAEGDVTAAGQTPTLLVTYDAIPVAVATATASVPLMELSADAAAFPLPLGLGGGLLRIPGSMAILRPQEIGQPQASSLFAVPVASATAAGLIPILLDTHQPSAGAVTATGQVPALLDTHQPPVGAVTVAGQVPSLAATWAPPVAAASATGLTPQLLATVNPGVAVTTAASPLPVLVITFASPVGSVTASAPSPIFTLIGAAAKAVLGIADAARTAITMLVSPRTSQAPADAAKAPQAPHDGSAAITPTDTPRTQISDTDQ